VSASDRLYLAARLPTLIMWGARDSLIPVRHGIAAHEAIPGSRLEIFEEVGHFPHCESPDRFVQTLVDFIDATEPASMPEQAWDDLLRCRTAAFGPSNADRTRHISHDAARERRQPTTHEP
jgi:hypothetical protein